jgi:hypothetical protein
MQRPVPAPLEILDGARDRVRRDADAVQFTRRVPARETGTPLAFCPTRGTLRGADRGEAWTRAIRPRTRGPSNAGRAAWTPPRVERRWNARAESLTQARAALASAVLADSRGQATCLRILEPLMHGGRLRRTALLLERPVPAWVEPHVLALHTQAGCQRRAPGPIPMDPQDLTEVLEQLPWSGEWLIAVVDRLSVGVLTDNVRPLAAQWVAERNAFLEAHVGLVRHVVNRHGWSAGVSREDLIQEGSAGAVPRGGAVRPGPRGAVLELRGARDPPRHRAVRAPDGVRAGTPCLARATTVGVSPAHSVPRNGAGRLRPPASLSLDAPLDDGESLADRLADPESLRPDLAAAGVLEHARLREALSALPAEVEEIVTLHWGLDGAAGRPVHAIARQVGRTPAEVRTVIRDALGVLRARVTAANGQGTPGCPRCSPPPGRPMALRFHERFPAPSARRISGRRALS